MPARRRRSPRRSRPKKKHSLKKTIDFFMLLNHEHHGGCGFTPMTMYRVMHADDPWDKENTRIVESLHFRTQRDKTALAIWKAGLPDAKRNEVDRENARKMKDAVRRREALYLLVDGHGYLRERMCTDSPECCDNILSSFEEPDKASNTLLRYEGAQIAPVPVAQVRRHAKFARSLDVGW
jgi:hypothetical protein